MKTATDFSGFRCPNVCTATTTAKASTTFSSSKTCWQTPSSTSQMKTLKNKYDQSIVLRQPISQSCLLNIPGKGLMFEAFMRQVKNKGVKKFVNIALQTCKILKNWLKYC